MIKKFLKNLKQYYEYLMTVNFRDLFVNVGILICILILSGFAYVPVGIIQDIIRNLIVIFVPLVDTGALLYNWFFGIISAIASFFVFMWLFDLRFRDIEAFKDQIRTKRVVNKTEKKEEKNDDNEKDDFELPKAKDTK